MKNTKYFICPDCQNISVSTGNAQISCCGKGLESLTLKKADEIQKLNVEIIEDELFISSNHPMTKENYISFVAFQTNDKIQIIKQYPEWNLQLRIFQRGHGMLLWFSQQEGLLYQLV